MGVALSDRREANHEQAPCAHPDKNGDCAYGLVALRWRALEREHFVPCLKAPALHVEGIDQRGRAIVYACRATYHWRLPHAT